MFVWTVENLGKEDVDVTIMLSFQNGDGGVRDSNGGHFNEAFMCKGIFSAVKLHSNKSSCNTPEKGSVGDNKAVLENAPTKKFSKTRGQKESCVTHDVSGVLLHHAHPNQPYTLAIAAKQVVRVSYLSNLPRLFLIVAMIFCVFSCDLLYL